MDFGGIPGLYQLDADGIPSPQQRFKVFPDIDKRPCEEYGPDRRELRGQKAVLQSQTHQVQVPTDLRSYVNIHPSVLTSLQWEK